MDLKTQFQIIEKHHLKTQQILNDPLSRVIKFSQKQDREVVALIAAVFAYGNVKQILSTVDKVLDLLGPSPYLKLKSTDGYYWKKTIPKTFKHRFNTARDLGILLTWLGEALRQNQSLEDLFLTPPGDLETQLENFISRITSYSCEPFKLPKSKGPYFFFPRPSNKSGCKRLLLFLRWMAGSGPMALGDWTRVQKSNLIIPVDTHILKISKQLGFTKRKDASWRTALEITAALKKITPEDPTRYDFAICHFGIARLDKISPLLKFKL